MASVTMTLTAHLLVPLKSFNTAALYIFDYYYYC